MPPGKLAWPVWPPAAKCNWTPSARPRFRPSIWKIFPARPWPRLQAGNHPGLTLRRAFRYTNTQAVINLKASAVEPDVRVETEDTLSLGEDRTVLADNFRADITRAGIFDLSFLLAPGFDVEAISGAALSQWTESKTAAGRVITLHLVGKTQGSSNPLLSPCRGRE